MWSPGETALGQPPGEFQIPLTALGPPPPAKLLEAALAIELGAGRVVDVHPVTRKIPRMLVVDGIGIRHIDRRKIRMEPQLNFAVRWFELARVELQIQVSNRTSLQLVRVVLTALDPATFAAQHPSIGLLNNLRGLGPHTWALSLGTDTHVNQQLLNDVRNALLRYAGPRFAGTVETIYEPGTPRTL